MSKQRAGTALHCMSGKPGYRTHQEAQKALGRVQARRYRHGDKMGTRRGLKVEHRTYLCEECDLHHLTSTPRREIKEKLDRMAHNDWKPRHP